MSPTRKTAHATSRSSWKTVLQQWGRKGYLAALLVVVGAVLLGLHFLRLSDMGASAKRPVPTRPLAQVEPSPSAETGTLALQLKANLIEPLAAPYITYAGSQYRNPFVPQWGEERTVHAAPPPQTAESLPTLVVHGIIWAEAMPYAIVNQQMVRAGDWVEGGHVVAIDRDTVVVQYGTQELRLHP